MRDYIFSLTLLAIFLGAYTALVVSFAKPIPSREMASAQRVAEPNTED
ncbi:MAG: hypothetical protein AAB250_13385 [Bdellovibrionota bacterium]